MFFQLYPGETLLPDFKKAGIEVKQFNFKPGYNFRELAQRILAEVQQPQPALIHSTLFSSDMMGREVNKLTGIPLINSLVNNSYIKQRYQAMSWVAKCKL